MTVQEAIHVVANHKTFGELAVAQAGLVLVAELNRLRAETAGLRKKLESRRSAEQLSQSLP